MEIKVITFKDLEVGNKFRVRGEKQLYEVIDISGNDINVLNLASNKEKSADKRINFIEIVIL